MTLGEGREFPAFFTRKSGFISPYKLQTAEEIAKLIGICPDTHYYYYLFSEILSNSQHPHPNYENRVNDSRPIFMLLRRFCGTANALY